jgi:hypothetical protein
MPIAAATLIAWLTCAPMRTRPSVEAGGSSVMAGDSIGI